MPKFNDIEIGTKAQINRLITKEDIGIFADLTGDRNPLHLDPKYAKEKMDFKAPIAHGMLTVSFLSTLIGMTLPGEGAIITSIKLDFRKPVFVDDNIELTVEVTKKIHLSKHVFSSVTITNQNAEVVVTGTVKSVCSD